MSRRRGVRFRDGTHSLDALFPFGLNCPATSSVTSVNTLWLPRYLRSKRPYAGHNIVSDLLIPVTLFLP